MIRHIAIIPDGTRRWAKRRGLPEMEGAKAGAENMHRIVAYLLDAGVKYLTIWGFSSDNWKRSSEQVGFLFEQAQAWIEGDAPWMHSRDVRLRHIGQRDRLPPGLQQAISHWGEVTRDNTGMTVVAAFDYSGRVEMIDTIRRIIEAGIPPKMVDVELLGRYLYTDGIPDVDLVIRTSGELRLSNFMLWQAAYSEFYFSPVLWPDFDEEELEKALSEYQGRKRRFGGN